MQKNLVKKRNIYRKILSCYIVGILLIASFVAIIPTTKAESPNDFIRTYFTDMGGLIESSEFDAIDSVIINVSLDNLSGPIDPPYCLFVQNNNTGEWIFFPVWDNSTFGPWGDENVNDDGIFWGYFNLTDSGSSQNGSGADPVLKVSAGDTLYIFEDDGAGPPNPLWDNDPEIATKEIMIEAGDDSNAPPDQPTGENPPDGSDNRPLDTDLSWSCNDLDGDDLTYDVYFGTSSPPPKQVENQSSTTYDPGTLSENTEYFWGIIAWDTSNESNSSAIWSFSTEASGGGDGQSGNSSISGFVKNETNIGIFEANVELYINGTSTLVNSTLTDGSGFYNITNLNSGTYDIKAYKPMQYPEEWIYNVNLAENQSISDKNFFLVGDSGGDGDENQTGNSSISGYVVYQDTYDPIRDAEVQIMDNSTSYLDVTLTSMDGYYNFSNLPTGDYDLVASKDMVFPPLWNSVTVSSDYTHIENLNFTVGSDDDDEDPGPGGIEGEINITVMGTVYQERSELAIPNVNVSAYPNNDPSNILNSTETDINGEFQLNFVINQSISENSGEICFIFTADGYVTNDDWQMGLYDMIGMMEQEGYVMMDWIELAKIWNIVAYVNGTIRDIDSNNPISNVTVYIEGPNYFENQTQTDNDGNFSIGSISGDIGDFEVFFDKDGYFTNATEIDQAITEGDFIDLGTLYMEVKPPSNAYIEGYVKSDDSPVEDVNLMLYDPLHPYESEKGFFDMPSTDSSGYYNISTYAGDFYLITLAKIIGETREGPPLGIGGFVNQVIDITVAANDTLERNISLTAASPDTITVNLNVINTSLSYARLCRTISANPKIVRMMTDSDLNGIIDTDEADVLKDSINSSFTQSGFFEEDMLLARIPFSYFKIDGTYVQPLMTNVDINGIIGVTDSSDPITVYVNMSMVPTDEIDVNATLHSIRVDGYYGNPAFNMNYTIQIPQAYSIKNKRQWMLTTTQLNQTTLRAIPNTDPNWNDTSFTEPIIMAVGTTNASAEFNEGYYYENPYDSDGDGDYDYFITKVKVNASQSGIYKIEGKLCSANGIAITNTDIEKTLSTGSNTIQLSFEAEKIYRKKIDGPYTIVYDLSISRNSSYIWYDSLQKTTGSYQYTDFTKPDIFFTGTIIDSGLDEDNNGLYDYLRIGLQVDVGTLGYYEFEGNIGTCDFSYQGDPMITGVRKGVTFVDYGEQYVNMSFDGGSIYAKGCNASIWVNIRVRSQTGSELDDIDTMTDKYYYDEFSPPPSESCTITGYIKDPHGSPLDADVWLWDEITMSENSTSANESTGEYSINARPGVYELQINPSNSYYQGHFELVVLSTNETFQRNITLLPSWSDCAYLDMELNSWQYAAGDNIFLNITASSLPNSNCTLEIFKDYTQDGDSLGEEYNSTVTNTTDENGEHMFVIDTSGFATGEYIFKVWVENESSSIPVARDDRWGIQISSLSIDFETDKNNYRPGSTGVGTYTLTYISNSSEVVNATYNWKILTWDWMGEHTLSSGTFTDSESGNGTFNFNIPSTANDGDWYDIRLSATDQTNTEVFTSRGIGITEGSVIESVEEYTIGNPGDYDYLVYNVTVNVTSAGTYRVESGLEDANYNWITFNDTQTSLNSGPNVVQIFFEGEQIKASQAEPGNWHSWIGLFYSNSWESLDDLDYTTSISYNKDDFATPAVCFEDVFSHYPINGSNGYSALIANATINASVAGSYNVDGNLYKEVLQSGGWYDWQGIAWNNSETLEITDNGVEGVNKTNSSIKVPIRFEGSDIYNSGYTGPFNINFNLHREGTGDTWITNYDPDTDLNYDYDDFERPGAIIENITDYGSVDGDLVIGVNISISEGYEGEYELNGDLQSSDWYWIGNTWVSDTLSNGTTEINLTFSGENIYSAGYGGPYRLHINLQRIDPYLWLGNYEYDTDFHSYTEFSTPGAIFEGSHSDQGYDEDNDGYYDYLQVTVPVEINETGSLYEVSGELYKETSTSWNWITWESEEFTPSSTGIYNVTIEFNANQIGNSGQEGYYGVNLWLRALGGSELDYIDFTTDNYYNLNEFEQPAVRFIENSNYPDDSNDSQYLNIDVKVNSTETGTYYVRGFLHKVINQGGWDNWIWITDAEEQIQFTTEGEQEVTLPFDISVIQSEGYNGPYTVSFKIMDSNWNILDNLNDYETDFYDFTGLGDIRPIYFTGDYDDYQRPSDDKVVVNLTVQVNETGTYSIGGDLHKESGYDWNYIASQWEDFTFTQAPSTEEIQLAFDSIEILSGIQTLSSSMQSTFSSGTNFDIDIWVRRSGEWSDLDQLSVQSSKTYQTSDFNTGGVTIDSVSDEGFNSTGDSKFEYLNVTATVNFTTDANFEVWCDLSKESSNDWQWLGWQGEYVTISSSEVSDGYEEETITLQFNGERLSSAGYDGPYNIHMEVENLDNGRRVANYDGSTSGGYQSTDFIGSTVEFNDSAISDTGIDTDSDGDYNYLSIDVPVISQENKNVELTADLRKQSNYGDEWISWTSNWTSITTGESSINVRFDAEIIRNSGLNGPYTLRLELWNTDTWKLLDSINSYETSSYSVDNFDAPAASIDTSGIGITDWGYDTDIPSDGLKNYLDVNVSLDISLAGNYLLQGDLYSDTSGWQWISNTQNSTYLETTDDMAILHFDGMKIRSKGIDGPYKVRIELRQDGRMIDSYEPYQTSGYNYNEFQASGAEIVSADDYKTSNGDLQLNVTVNASTDGDYWLGADLHKQSGWDWQWISWQSNEGDDEFDANEQKNITILFSGQTIRNSEIDGPYQIRIELRDVDTWTEQDMMEQYTTNEYSYSDFAEPDLTLVSVEDWGNDTDDADSYYNYLELNVTVDCSNAGTYWMHGDLEKRSGYDWQWITWKGQQIELDGTGQQVVKLKFDGERIYDSSTNGPYTARVEIMNETTWTMIDSIDDYSTSSYSYTDFQSSTVTFVESDTYPSDQGVGTEGSYSSLKLTIAVNSSTAGDYWLQCDLHKESPGSWQWIDWQGETISHDGNGIQLYNVTFDGSQIRNKGIDGPYDVRIELNSNTGEWRQYDVIDQYQTNSYDSTDFASAGIEFVDMADGSDDEIVNGNLKLNVTVNSTVSGKYMINGDLHKESGYNWQWISFNSTEINVDTSGEQSFNLIFEGSDIYERGIDGPYHVRLELRKVGTNSLKDTIDRYTTSTYYPSNFSAPSGSINDTDDTTNNGNLQVNITTYSTTNKEYQYSGVLLAGDYTDIAWDQNTTDVNGEEIVYLSFDGSLINDSGKNPEKVYVEMRRTSDMELVDSGEFDLVNSYTYSDFGASVSIGEVTFGGVHDSSDNGYDYLSILANVTFNTAGSYSLSAALVDPNGSYITGKNIPSDSYSTGVSQINFSFDGLKIYSKKLNGPYTVSYISVSKSDIGEITRTTNAYTTTSYLYSQFEHNSSAADGYIVGNYSSSVIDSNSDGEYDYLAITVTINVTSPSDDFNLYGDLYSSSGTTWITSDYNNSDYSDYWNVGENTTTLYFKGDDIYSSETDGPYMLGYLRLGANIGGTWVLLDEESNVYTTSSYNYTDFESDSVSPLGASGVTEITASNDPFSPNSDGTKDTTLITVSADGGQDLYLNIYNSTSVLKKTGLSLSETSPGSGTYTATWNGKDNNNSVLTDDTYRLKVSDEETGNQANESAMTQTVVLDTTAPTGASLEIESGDAYTNTTVVSLTTISATDTSDKKMRFKNAGGSYTDWEDFQSSRDWTLASTDGSKTVYYQVKDVAGNTATEVSDSITLDTTKPSSVILSITGKGDTPSTYSNDQSVTLSISAEDATSGVEYMIIANDITFSGRTWEEYNTSKEWTLTSSNGAKTVYIKVKDRAGKISDIYSGNITLDTTTPTNLDVSINSDQTYTNSTSVTLTLDASDSYNMKMRFNNSGGNWSNWESYSQSKSWTLSNGSGTKTVYYQVKDLAGNTATAVSDSITLDTTAPVISSTQSSGITQTSATITWSTGESSTSIVEYGTTTDYGSTETNTTKLKSHSIVLDGLSSGTTYHYRVKSRDTAGNLRTGIDKTFTTSTGADTTPPSAIAGLSASDKSNAESTVSLSWNQSNAPDFAGYKVYRRTSSFTNVSLSGVQLLSTITSRSTTSYDDTTATDDTTFYYAVTAIDTASPPNENQDVTAVSAASVDDKAPTTSDNIPAGWQTSEVTVTLTATDNGKGVNKTYYTTDGSDPINGSNSNRTQYTSPFTVGGENTIGDGVWTIKFYSYDKNTTPNVESVHTETLRVDTTNPSTTDNAPSGWQTSTPVTVTLNATDDTSGVYKTYYTKDGSAPTTASDQYSTAISFTSQGNRTLKYFTKDNASNSESIKTSHILIDTVRPTSSVTVLSQYSSLPFNVSWSCDEDVSSGIKNVTIQVKNGSGSWIDWLTGQDSSGTSSFSSGTAGNTYYFRSIAIDNATNVETDYDSNGDTSTTVVISTMTASITSPSNNAYIKDSVNITGTASGPEFSMYWLNYSSNNGSSWTNIGSSASPVSSGTLATWNTSAVEGTEYILRLFVKNITGVNNSISVNVTVDNTAPDITSGPSAGSVDENSAVISWTTNETTNATVEYGTTDSYGATETSSYDTSHSITLASLNDDTTYHYRVISYDRAGNSVNSTDSTFTTDEASGGGSPGGGLPSLPGGDSSGLSASAGGSYEGTVGSSIEFSGSASGGTSPYSYSWDFGDGSTSDEQNPSHSYDSSGTYTATLTVTDSDSDTATDTAEVTVSEASEEDDAPVIADIKYSPSLVTSNDTVIISAKITDDNEVTDVNLYWSYQGLENSKDMSASGSSYSTNIGPFDFGETIYYSIDATDSAGQTTQSGTFSFTIKKKVTVEDIEDADETGVDGVDITTGSDVQNVKVTVEKKTDVDPGTEYQLLVDEDIYTYLEISIEADDQLMDDDDIDSLTIKFKVTQEWIDNEDINKSKVKLVRYHNGTWQNLTTTIIDEDENYVYYEAVTSGTSTFAVVGGKMVDVGEEEPEEPGTMPWYLIIIGVIVAILLVIVFLFKSGFLYFEEASSKKNNKK